MGASAGTQRTQAPVGQQFAPFASPGLYPSSGLLLRLRPASGVSTFAQTFDYFRASVAPLLDFVCSH